MIKPLFFLLQAEKAHHLTTRLLQLITAIAPFRWIFSSLYKFEDKRLEKEVFGLKFKNPVGLAAGFDKDGKHLHAMSHLGFGFVEIGTVTPKPQDGNPVPRLFRLPASEALINRMGFNNDGVEALVKRLKSKKSPNCIIGGNIGKNKITPNDKAEEDYKICFQALYPYVDYFVVNVSSPNTPGLRELQEKEPLSALLRMLQHENQATGAPKPILLKIAPDLTNEQLDDIIEIIKDTHLAGVIATNTTIERSGLQENQAEVTRIGQGGLSGQPLKNRATAVIRYLHDQSKGAFPIIGVGGIQKPEDALEKIQAGAALVQIYTGMIYEGPGIVKRMNRFLADQM